MKHFEKQEAWLFWQSNIIFDLIFKSFAMYIWSKTAFSILGNPVYSCLTDFFYTVLYFLSVKKDSNQTITYLKYFWIKPKLTYLSEFIFKSSFQYLEIVSGFLKIK